MSEHPVFDCHSNLCGCSACSHRKLRDQIANLEAQAEADRQEIHALRGEQSRLTSVIQTIGCRPRTAETDVILANNAALLAAGGWRRCAGHCGYLVSTDDGLCLTCRHPPSETMEG